MKRITSTILALFLLLGFSANAAALDNRSSKFFAGYIIGLYPKGNGKMSVAFSVLGKENMDKIGVYSLQIQESIGDDEWIETFTVYGEDDPDTFFTYDNYDHTGEYFFYGVPGVEYRAVMVSYAENSSGHAYSREITCTPKICK